MRVLTMVAAVCLGAAAGLSAGCTDRREARDAAGSMNRLVHGYAASRAAKVSEEQAFNARQLEVLRSAYSGVSSTAISDLGTDPLVTFEALRARVRNSVAYGRITSETNRDAYLEAERMVLSNGAVPVWQTVGAFVEKGLARDRELFTETRARAREIETAFAASLSKLDGLDQKLRDITAYLAELEQDEELRERLEKAYEFGRAAADAVDEALDREKARKKAK